MLAVTQSVGQIAASGTASVVYGPITSGTRTLLAHLTANYGSTGSTTGVTASFTVSPMATNGTAAGYVASNVKPITVKPAANGFADAEAVFGFFDNPYNADGAEVAYITILLTNNDSSHACNYALLTEDERDRGR